MGCEKHPVESEIRFLDGRVERFINQLPCTRWQRLTEWDTLFVALILAMFFAVVVELVSRLLK
jgi:hypothetical protein